MTYILGGWQSDFSDNWARRGVDMAGAFAETMENGLDAVKLDPKDVETGHVGNFAAELFINQGLLGGMFGLVHPDFNGLPTSRHEAACASGSIAILAATAEIEAGRYDLACVVGVEQMRNVPGLTAAQYLGSAAWTGHEFAEATYVWPRAFSNLTEEYDRRYGIDMAHLSRIAEVNFANGRRNPNAQTRGWQFTDASFTDDPEANPVVEGRMRKTDCGQVTDGSSVIFLASPERAKRYADERGIPLESLARISGWGHRSAPLPYRRKIEDSANASHVLPQVKRAVEDARARAGIAMDTVDAYEVHDCFTMTEYMAIDHLGLSNPGEAWKRVEDGSIEIGGANPINPSGGLIGGGHPVGATGIRMVLDGFKQVTNAAGDYQVEGAKTLQTLNIGGSSTTAVSFIVQGG